MGALLDPVVDRLTILSGAVVCWHFELLPRWALAVLAVRELVTLVLAQYAVRREQDLQINWYGRIAVFPVMGAIFWSMVVESVVWDVMLVIGVALALAATVAYARDGLRSLSANEPSTPG
jgi:cardiolipin synthase